MQKILIGREFGPEIIDQIKNAKQSVKIIIYDWRWYYEDIGSSIQIFNQELLKASNRGVDVSVVVNSDYVSQFLKNTKIKVKKLDSKKTLHIKLVVIDERIMILGSHNFTKNAFEINHEISVLIEDQDSIKKCLTFFNNIYN